MRLLALLTAALLLAGCGTDGPGGDGPGTGSTTDGADGTSPQSPAGLVKVATFEGVSAGVGACDNAVPTAQQPEPVPIARNATSVRLEIAYTATAPGGLNELSVSVHRDQAAVGGANFITSKQGPSPIVLDIVDDDWGAASALRALVYNCNAPAEQPYDGYASFFADAIPGNYTAVP